MTAYHALQQTPKHMDYQNVFFHADMLDEQKSYIDLNYTNNHSNIELTNAKRSFKPAGYGLKGSTDRKSSAVPMSPLTRHLTN
mmetsp:Transcript_40223/g.52705  ORF Transcript_40223/g.52705 Transcript_40223/m.52705 type:complete len:83 (+) Transcript_40223:909-1157(+)